MAIRRCSGNRFDAAHDVAHVISAAHCGDTNYAAGSFFPIASTKDWPRVSTRSLK
jgi:hypothetical protein